MSTAIKLDQMSTAEKLEVMERLWVDLSSTASEALSPDWHGEVLGQREDKVAEQQADFIPWEEAKKRLRDSL